MRLINVITLDLEQYYGDQTPQYAILSHTWDGDNEVTFQEWERRADSAIRRKSGYAKIMEACHRARADGLRYLWCDTNCIDKTSSAELSEAINSMFAWYRDSRVCYAYLADFQKGTGDFRKSRWYTRGWTLQELLAPKTVIFFDQSWIGIGDKIILADKISDITKIHKGALMDRSTIHNYSIAQRMSWAADRETTRTEDIAYCLLGIFDINMPLLYGEGSKAFERLQREIIKISNDQSILAWDSRRPSTLPLTSALAPSPTEFRFCGSIVRNHEILGGVYSITNLGVSLKLPLVNTFLGGLVFVGLNCAQEMYREVSPQSRLPDGVKLSRLFQIWIPLRHLHHNIFVRTHYPSSKIFLNSMYSILGHPKATELFLSLDMSQAFAMNVLGNHIGPLHPDASFSPSRVLMTIASGKTSTEISLGKAYPLGNIYIVQLKPQGPCTVSHQLISSGHISVIFSVLWSKDGSPQQSLHTNIFDPNLKNSSQMASQTEWNSLFGTERHVQSCQCCNSSMAMNLIHEKLRQRYGKQLCEYADRGEDPTVIVDKQILRDSFGQQNLVVDVIFRERPNS